MKLRASAAKIGVMRPAAHRVSCALVLAVLASSGLARGDDAPDDLSSKIHGAEPGEMEATTAANLATPAPLPPPFSPPPPRVVVAPGPVATRPFNRGILIAGAGAAAASIPVLILGASIKTYSPSGVCREPEGEQGFSSIGCGIGGLAGGFGNAMKELVLIGGGCAGRRRVGDDPRRRARRCRSRRRRPEPARRRTRSPSRRPSWWARPRELCASASELES